MTLRTTGMQEDGASIERLGKHQRVATLGQGGMGTVHLALANGFGHFRKLIVVKELRQDLTRQKDFIRLFMDEAKLAARLSHPNVVETFEAIQEGGRYFLTMEYLDGQPLSGLIKRLGSRSERMPLAMHIQILCEVLSGLHYAHELQDYDGSSLHVVHRDVSPQNVFLTYHGEVKVVDFGVAKAANASVSTAPGTFVGKFAYAAPEQVLGRSVDARTDVFAVGAMLWQAIAGRRFSATSPTPEAFQARAEGLEPRIATVVPDVDPELAAICDRALAVDRQQRYPTAQAFRVALQDYLLAKSVRVEAAEIGQLMRSMFEEERRALHHVIEAAVRTNGTEAPTGRLSFLQPLDKEPTAVADLSNLIDVSIQRDEQKIRDAVAQHTKVTRLRTTGRPSGGPPLVPPPPAFDSSPAGRAPLARPSPMPTPVYKRSWMLTAAALAFVLSAIYWTFQRDKATPNVKPLTPIAVVPAPSDTSSANTAPIVPELKFVAEQEAAVPTPVSPTVPSARNARPLPMPSPTLPSTRASRPRPSPVSESVAPVVQKPSTAAEPSKPTTAAAGGRRLEAGADLGVPRREAPTPIDLDNPYR